MEKEITDSIRNPSYRNNPTERAVKRARKRLGKPKPTKPEPFDEAAFVAGEAAAVAADGVHVHKGVVMRTEKVPKPLHHENAPMLVAPEDALTSEQKTQKILEGRAAAAAQRRREEQQRFIKSRYLAQAPSPETQLALPPEPKLALAAPSTEVQPIFVAADFLGKKKRQKKKKKKKRERSLGPLSFELEGDGGL